MTSPQANILISTLNFLIFICAYLSNSQFGMGWAIGLMTMHVIYLSTKGK